MQWQCRMIVCLAALVLVTVAAPAQEMPQPATEPIQPGYVVPVPAQPRASSGLEAESLPGELTEDIAQPPGRSGLGPPRSRR